MVRVGLGVRVGRGAEQVLFCDFGFRVFNVSRNLLLLTYYNLLDFSCRLD